MSEVKKSKYLTKTVHFKGQSLTMFSLDGVTWSTKKTELEAIKERQEAQRASLLNGKVSSAPLGGAGEGGFSGNRGQSYAQGEEEGPGAEGFEPEADETRDMGFDETELDREEEELNTNFTGEEEEAEPAEETDEGMPDLLNQIEEESGKPSGNETAAATGTKRLKEKPAKRPAPKSSKPASPPVKPPSGKPALKKTKPAKKLSKISKTKQVSRSTGKKPKKKK